MKRMHQVLNALLGTQYAFRIWGSIRSDIP